MPINIDSSYMRDLILHLEATLDGFGLRHDMLHSILMGAELKEGVSAQSGAVDGGSGYSGVVAPGPWHTSPALLLSRALVGVV